MNEILLPRIVGVVGGGQLARMMVQAAINLPGPTPHIKVLEKVKEDGLPCPATLTDLGDLKTAFGPKGADQIDGDINDAVAIDRLVDSVDVTTWELEHITARALWRRQNAGDNIQPSPMSLMTIQDKYRQKQRYVARNLATPKFGILDSVEDLRELRNNLGSELMVKARTGGYDGRGNLPTTAATSWSDIRDFFSKNGDMSTLYAEEMVDFKRELALTGARDMFGNIAFYPLVQTIQKDSICHTVVAPAQIDPWLAQDAVELGTKGFQSFKGAGVMTMEMLQDQNGKTYLNEFAPRPHNAGHWTIDGAVTSQFEQHLRAILGMPLGDTSMKPGVKATRMVNILGSRTGEFDTTILDVLNFHDRDIHPNWYGKKLRPARKVGHVNFTSSISAQAAESLAEMTMPLINA